MSLDLLFIVPAFKYVCLSQDNMALGTWNLALALHDV